MKFNLPLELLAALHGGESIQSRKIRENAIRDAKDRQ
jgi:hypothetical protein